MDDLNVVVAIESWRSLWSDAQPLMLAHKRELARDDPRAPLDPDHEALTELQESGHLLVLGARVAGQLVGYSLWYIVPSLETRGLLIGQQAPWYVTPDWRSARIGLRLWRVAKQQLRSSGVKMLSAHYPPVGAGAELGPFFAREGGTLAETVVEIWIGDP